MLLAVLVCAGSTTAQESDLAGKVLDFSNEAAISAARIELVDGSGKRVSTSPSDSAGSFRFRGISAGTYQLRAQAFGYQEVLTPTIEVPPGDTVQVVVRLAADAVPLAPLEITARAAPLHRNPGLAGYLARIENRLGGTIIPAEEIAVRSPRRLTDLLVATQGMMVVEGILINKRRQCAPTVYLDGIRITHEAKGSSNALKEAFEAVNLLSPSLIEGVEVYPGPATVPGEFVDSNAGCGVILIWSRRGPPAGKR